MTDSRIPPGKARTEGELRREYRPSDRFWPYVEVAEEPSPEELAALDPDLHEVLFGPSDRPFSVTITFPRFEGTEYGNAVALARASSEYREIGTGPGFRHWARFLPTEAVKLRDLFEIVGGYDECEVLINDRPVPYARELWLPLMWFLIPSD